MLTHMLKYDALRQVGRAAIITMETNGGLTVDELVSLKIKLEEKRFDLDKLHINYTPYPVDYGGEVKISLQYTHPTVTYTVGLEGLKRDEKELSMVYGPVSSISKKYRK